MDFEEEFNMNKIKYKFIGIFINGFYKYEYKNANGILISIENPKLKYKLSNGIIKSF